MDEGIHEPSAVGGIKFFLKLACFHGIVHPTDFYRLLKTS